MRPAMERALISTSGQVILNLLADTDLCNILAGTKEGIGIDNRLQLLLDAIKPYQLIQQVLSHKRLSAPLAKLGNIPVFLMTMFANHHSMSFSN